MGNGKGRFNQQLHCGNESRLAKKATEKGHKNRMTGKRSKWEFDGLKNKLNSSG